MKPLINLLPRIALAEERAVPLAKAMREGNVIDGDELATQIAPVADEVTGIAIDALRHGMGDRAAEYLRSGMSMHKRLGDVGAAPAAPLGPGWDRELSSDLAATSTALREAIEQGSSAELDLNVPGVVKQLREFANEADAWNAELVADAPARWGTLSARLAKGKDALTEGMIALAITPSAAARRAVDEVRRKAIDMARFQGRTRRFDLNFPDSTLHQSWVNSFDGPARAARLAADLLEGRRPASVASGSGASAWAPAALDARLATLGTDLTEQAARGKLPRPVGRFREIQELLDRLASEEPGSRSASLLAESGTGKTAIVEGAAHRIVAGDVPERLRNKRLVALDTGELDAHAGGNIGPKESQLQDFIAAAKETDTPVFIDELHRLFGAGTHKSRTTGYSNNFLEPVERGEVAVIGATTHADLEHARLTHPIDAFMRRLRRVEVSAPSEEEVAHIVRRRALDVNSSDSGVLVMPDGVEAVQKLGDRYLPHLNQPARGVEVLKKSVETARRGGDPRELREAQATVERLRTEIEFLESAGRSEADLTALRAKLDDADHRLLDLEEEAADGGPGDVFRIGREQVADAVSQLFGARHRFGSPEERSMLEGLEQSLGANVLGQEEAVSKTANLVRRSRMGLGDAVRPASILYKGATGTGKTELAESVAETLSGSRDELTYLAMGDYASYGQARPFAQRLAEQVKAHPGRVVLFDELEKGEEGVRKVLLEVLEKGRVTNPETHEVVKLPMGTIIATTNEASDTFAPEFLNRFDDVAAFRELTPESIHSIAGMQLGKSAARAREVHGIQLEWSEAAVQRLGELGYDPEMGARPMRRAVQHHVDDQLALLVLSDTPPSRVRVDVRDGQIVLGPQLS